METKKYVLGFVAAMIAGAAVAMTACVDAPQRTDDRLAEVEKQLIEERSNTALAEERGKTALAEERLEETNRLLLEALLAQEEAVLAKEEAERATVAAQERVRASMAGQEEARARYECNKKIADVFRIFRRMEATRLLDSWEEYDLELSVEDYMELMTDVLGGYYAEDTVELLARWGSYTLDPARNDGWSPMIDDLEDGQC